MNKSKKQKTQKDISETCDGKQNPKKQQQPLGPSSTRLNPPAEWDLIYWYTRAIDVEYGLGDWRLKWPFTLLDLLHREALWSYRPETVGLIWGLHHAHTHWHFKFLSGGLWSKASMFAVWLKEISHVFHRSQRYCLTVALSYPSGVPVSFCVYVCVCVCVWV